MIYSIKIIHPVLQGGEYRLLADFFRLVGCHVCDCILKNETPGIAFDAVIIVEGEQTNGSKEFLDKNYPCAVWVEKYDFSNSEIEGNRKYLQVCLSELKEKVQSSAQAEWELEYTLCEIAEVYADCQFMKYRNIHSYFYEDQKQERQVQKKFTDAFLRINELYKKQQVASDYLSYARINLARFLNESCVFLGQRLLFDTRLCVEELDRVLKRNPSFNNAEMLKGFLTEGQFRYMYESEMHFRSAINSMPKQSGSGRDYPYASYPIYRLGRFYEKIKGEPEEAGVYYQRAYSANPSEYRAIYKLAILENRKGLYRDALGRFHAICNILEEKVTANYLQPREYEYLLKAYLGISNICNGKYLNEGNEERARIGLEDMFRRIGEGAGGNQIYCEIFDCEAGKYLSLTKKRLVNKMNCTDM